ncbi:Mth938-like domain-containing protein [Undibacterium fentianense]|uniref:Mth938-like domain-containing protein n=1 Tax=Undibacterium fentianense TaxID=2828728 RepID=A0A941IC82_9BURK|nr:Mth938-like domain-containing protein [Undibacterium fentianense]MBR7798588.1 Mth938-like domain-containing protein [Undibacterium fentianense]
MKLHATNTQQYQTVTAYDDEGVEFNLIRYEYSLIVLPEVAPIVLSVSNFESLQAEHFREIAASNPDVVILGTGKKQRFVHPKLIADLSAQHKGVECMDNQAACRTYNILMTEGRKVALALILEKT